MQPGTLLGARYRVDRPAAQGTSGNVHQATDTVTGRAVAVKLLAPGKVETETIQTEQRALATLSSPHVALLLDVGLMGETPYVVSPWIEGSSLATRLREGPLPLADALRVTQAIGRALAAAHQIGLIHRDVKPDNILIPDGTRYADAVLIDFGLAGRLRRDLGNTTVSGQVYGTVRYMSPEQVQGLPQTELTDLYGLALVCHEMLTGRLPYPGDSLGHVLQDKVAGHLAIRPQAGTPPSLFALLERCLQANPHERPPLDELLRVVAGLQRAPEEQDRPRLTHKPHPSAVASPRGLLFTVYSALLAALIAFGLLFLGQIGFPPTVARALAGTALGAAFLVGGVALGRWLRAHLEKAHTQASSEAFGLLTGVRSRQALSESLALRLDQFVEQVRSLDGHFLVGSVALLLTEYRDAAESKDRQAALMNAVALVEKITAKLSPWYVRHKDAVATAVSVTGILTGIATAVANAWKAFHP